jgi:hypothetical protein
LVKPIPRFSDETQRRAFHDRAAAKLRVSGPAKRAESAQKSKDTRKKNKEAREAVAQ